MRSALTLTAEEIEFSFLTFNVFDLSDHFAIHGRFIFPENTVLPVEWLSFDVENDDDQINLYWATASEINVSHFEIQHSIDGLVFQFIEEIEAVGNSSEVSFYDSYDVHKIAGYNYYRIKEKL